MAKAEARDKPACGSVRVSRQRFAQRRARQLPGSLGRWWRLRLGERSLGLRVVKSLKPPVFREVPSDWRPFDGLFAFIAFFDPLVLSADRFEQLVEHPINADAARAADRDDLRAASGFQLG